MRATCCIDLHLSRQANLTRLLHTGSVNTFHMLLSLPHAVLHARRLIMMLRRVGIVHGGYLAVRLIM